MARTDQCIVRPSGHLGQAGMHLRGRAFKQSSTAKRHEAVAGKGRGQGRDVKGDMSDRVTRDVNHLHLETAKVKCVTFGKRYVQIGQAVRVGAGTKDTCGIIGQQRG